MQVENINQNDKFDNNLRSALTAPLEHIRPDFADDITQRLKKRYQQKLLAKVILQERLALAGCILTPAAALLAMFTCPQLVTGLSAWMNNCLDTFSTLITTEQFNWQIWTILAAVALAIYSLINLFLTDS